MAKNNEEHNTKVCESADGLFYDGTRSILAGRLRLTLVKAACTFARLVRGWPRFPSDAQVAELVDALVSGASGVTPVEVRVLSWAPFKNPRTSVDVAKSLKFPHFGGNNRPKPSAIVR